MEELISEYKRTEMLRADSDQEEDDEEEMEWLINFLINLTNIFLFIP